MQKSGPKHRTSSSEPRSPVFETQRMTLLEAFEDRHEKQKKQLLHRLVYVGSFRGKEMPETCAFKMIQVVSDLGLQGAHNTFEPLTGMLLVYNDHFVHIVEGLYDQLFNLIKLCTEIDRCLRLNIGAIRIVNIAHDISQRLFYTWQWKFVNIHRVEDLNVEKPLHIVSEFLERLTKLSNFMAHHSLHELDTAIDELVESVRDSLPSEVAVSCLFDLPLQSAEEFIGAFESSCTFVLDDELVWPMVVSQVPLT